MADQVAVGNAEQPGQEARRDNAPLKLETLPCKIISLILATMTIDVDEPYVVDQSTLQPSATRKKEDTSARRDLTNLCMVSKQMVSKARPALYRNILIHDSHALVLLYRTFLEKPQFGEFVKRMSLDICHGARARWIIPPFDMFSRIDIAPLLSHAQHGFGDHLTVDSTRSENAYCELMVERLYTLQFKVLSRTSKLEFLDFNVHPISKESGMYMWQSTAPPIYMEVIRRVLPLLWKETLPCLSRLKELQLIGKERNCAVWGRRNHYAADICRYFLTLPKLQQLVWFNHDVGWFDTFPCRMLSGPDQRLRADAESIRTLKFSESPCLPHDLAALCSIFPHLKSLSVDTDSEQCRERLRRLVSRPIQLHAKEDTNSGLVTLFLTDSLVTLENLTTLNLDLHYACDISRSLGSLGTLSLAGLPNLQTLAAPFHFFVGREPDGHHRVVSPSSVLPRALKTLRIVACFHCLGHRIYKNPKFVECYCGSYRIRGSADDRAPCKYQHPDAVLEFLEGITNLRTESFPNLSNIFYEESKPYPITHQHRTWKCPHPPTEILMHCNRDTPDALRLTAVSEYLRQSGVVFKMRATKFGCRREPEVRHPE